MNDKTKHIYTSYYARNSANEKSVSISASAPDYFKGPRMAELTPSWDLLNSFKEGNINQVEYGELYIELLKSRDLTAQKIYDSIHDETILLCYEKAGEFCHRRVLAEWLEDELGVEIKEWQTEEELKKAALVDDTLIF